jgi:hypothetical protein
MMQSSLPGFPRLVEPSNNSRLAASQNALGQRVAVLAKFFRFQIIGARLAWFVLVMARLVKVWACRCFACGNSHHQNKLKP